METRKKISLMIFGFGMVVLLLIVSIHYLLGHFHKHGESDLLFISFGLLLLSYFLSKKVGFYISNVIDTSKIVLQENYKLKTAIEQSPVSIIITDINGNLEYVNPWFTKVTGYSYEEVIGKNPRILKTDFKSKGEYEILWNELILKHTWTGIFKNKKKNGEFYWESAIITPMFDGDGNIVNYLGIQQEITEELYLKQQLQDKEELMITQSRHAAMGEMISMIAHQWRQPISVIAMGANNILADIELDMLDTETLRKGARDIITQTQHLSKTIDDFRNFFKPNKNIEDVNLSDLIDESMKIMRKSLETNDIEIVIDVKKDLVIQTYSRELLQVIINIIKNAKEVMVEKNSLEKKIKIEIYKKGNNLCHIKIEDSGGGFDEGIKEKLFNPYFTTKDEKTGTGLGLYMSKIIVEKHLKGNIFADNINKGACFEIVIPTNLELKGVKR